MQLKELIRTVDESPAPRLVVYGVHGIGKTTFGSYLPKPIFLRTEDGMKGQLFEGVPRLPLCSNYEEVKEQLTAILTQEHEYKSLVLDSLDWLEQLIQADVAEEAGVGNISEIGYQAGYKQAAGKMLTVLTLMSEINRRRGMLVCALAHSEIKRYTSPDQEPYDRYGLALHKDAAPLVYEWADAVLFVNYKTFTRKVGESFGTAQYQALGEGERVMYAEERPAFHAKNRFGLSPELPFVWSTLKEEIFAKRKEK